MTADMFKILTAEANCAKIQDESEVTIMKLKTIKKLKRILCSFMAAILLCIGSSAVLVGCSCGGGETQSETEDNESIYSLNKNFYNDAKLGEWPGIFDFLTDSLIMSGKSMISSQVSSFGISLFNSLLTQMGYDMRSAEQKQLDNISNQLEELQGMVSQGFQNVMRNQIKIRNDEVMNDLLTQLQEVGGPVSALVKTMSIIAEMEVSGEYTEDRLQAQKVKFAEDCNDLKFSSLTQNQVWFSCKMLAENIKKPSKANVSVDLWTLYEDTYGSLETWDYMTVEPRTEFICYLAFIVNSMAQLSQVAASYKISLLPEGDVNINTITDGVDQMITAVNAVNELFQNKLNELKTIKEKHDDEHLITHRNRTVDSMGNIVVTEGVTLSTRLLPATTGNSASNYLCFDHDEGRRESSTSTQYDDYIYNLNSLDMSALYDTVCNEYENYCLSIGCNQYDYSTFTIKDYLAECGFTCEKSEKDNLVAAKGFYLTMTCFKANLSDGRSYYTNLMCAYYDFANHTPSFVDVSRVLADCSFWTHAYKYSVTNNYDQWFICFIQPDQKTICGTIDSIVISHGGSKQSVTTVYEKLWHGANKWSRDKGDKVTIG